MSRTCQYIWLVFGSILVFAFMVGELFWTDLEGSSADFAGHFASLAFLTNTSNVTVVGQASNNSTSDFQDHMSLPGQDVAQFELVDSRRTPPSKLTALQLSDTQEKQLLDALITKYRNHTWHDDVQSKPANVDGDLFEPSACTSCFDIKGFVDSIDVLSMDGTVEMMIDSKVLSFYSNLVFAMVRGEKQRIELPPWRNSTHFEFKGSYLSSTIDKEDCALLYVRHSHVVYESKEWYDALRQNRSGWPDFPLHAFWWPEASFQSTWMYETYRLCHGETQLQFVDLTIPSPSFVADLNAHSSGTPRYLAGCSCADREFRSGKGHWLAKHERMCICHSDNGLEWSMSKPVVNRAVDTFVQVFYNPTDQYYYLINRWDVGTPGGWREIRGTQFWRASVKNQLLTMTRFEKDWKVVQRFYLDQHMQKLSNFEQLRRQQYGFTMSYYRPAKLFFGLSHVIEWPYDDSEGPYGEQTNIPHQRDVLKTYLVPSRDGKRFDFEWLYGNVSLFERGGPGEFDRDSVLSQGNILVWRNQFVVFYEGQATRHNAPGRPTETGFGMVTFPEGCLVVVQQQNLSASAAFVTKPFKIKSKNSLIRLLGFYAATAPSSLECHLIANPTTNMTLSSATTHKLVQTLGQNAQWIEPLWSVPIVQLVGETVHLKVVFRSPVKVCALQLVG